MKVSHYKGYIHVVEIPRQEIKLIDFDICKQPKETISKYYDRQEVKPDVICNAGFFCTTSGLTIFNYVDDFEKASQNELYKWGIGTLDDTNLAYGSVDMYNFKDFMCGYPVLLSNFEIQNMDYAADIKGRNPRTVFGFNGDFVYIVCVDGRMLGKPGMTLQELAEFMLSIGCQYAVNLDGGGSSRVLVNGIVENTPLENRAVDSVLAIYLKKEEVKEYKQGDVVYFKGGNTYSTSLGGLGKSRQAAYCTITKKVSGKKYNYHLVSLAGEPSVYGWTNKDSIAELTENDKIIMDLLSNQVISDKSYWLNVLNGNQTASADNIKALLNNVLSKLK